MALYAINLSVTSVVEAKTAEHAYRVAFDHRREIFSECPRIDLSELNEVRAIDDLPDEWDADCLPYGGDGDTTIREILGGAK